MYERIFIQPSFKTFVHMGQSLPTGVHSPVELVFIDHNFCVGGGVRLFQALFCEHAIVINETPEFFPM